MTTGYLESVSYKGGMWAECFWGNHLGSFSICYSAYNPLGTSHDANDSNFVFFKIPEYRNTKHGHFDHWWPVPKHRLGAGLLWSPKAELGTSSQSWARTHLGRIHPTCGTNGGLAWRGVRGTWKGIAWSHVVSQCTWPLLDSVSSIICEMRVLMLTSDCEPQRELKIFYVLWSLLSSEAFMSKCVEEASLCGGGNYKSTGLGGTPCWLWLLVAVWPYPQGIECLGVPWFVNASRQSLPQLSHGLFPVCLFYSSKVTCHIRLGPILMILTQLHYFRIRS